MSGDDAMHLAALTGLIAIALAACGGDDACPAGSVASGDRCVAVDAGPSDGGDAGPPDGGDAGDLGIDEGVADAGPCGMACTGATAVCDQARGVCAECTAADDPACSGDTPVCDVTAGSATLGECVACNADADCTSVTSPQCDVPTHACVPCTANTACTGRTGTTVCDTAGGGACVQCTGADRSACGMNVCDVTARTCATAGAASAQLCETCVSDAQCQGGQVCVAMSGGSPSRALGHFCLWREAATGMSAPNGACSTTRPYIQGAERSALEAGTLRVCEPALATCEALLDFRTTTCTPPAPTVPNAACGAADVDDGYCQLFHVATNNCTVACTDFRDCPDPLGPACYRCTAGVCSFTTGTESMGMCM